MSASKTVTSPEPTPVVPPAVPADVALASELISSNRKRRGWAASPQLVELFSNAKMQTSLRGASKELGVLGIDVEEVISTANEAATAFAALARLDESAGRVHQRVVELNKRLLNGQTSLLNAKVTAAPGTVIARALRGLASLRQNQVAQSKRVRTNRKKEKSPANEPDTGP